MKFSSMIRGGSGEAFQYAFHGPGFVVVQPSEWAPPTQASRRQQRRRDRRPVQLTEGRPRSGVRPRLDQDPGAWATNFSD